MAKTNTADFKNIDTLIKQYKDQGGGLVGILQEIQSEYNYLPKEVLLYVTQKLDIPLSQTYSLATFYKAFSLKPRGKFLISVCMGTACHVRRGSKIVDEISRLLNIKVGETTDDLTFTLETVNCLGCCAIGPVMQIDDKYYGHMTSKKVSTILQKYKTKNKEK